MAEKEERYLGALLTKNNSGRRTGNMLLERLKAKLTGWRSDMLSHAGRLVLIKSVLLSIPLFFMSVEIIPKGLIKQMESLIAKFFWGKTDKNRYLSLVAWARICQPTDKGGLGVRQLQSFGDALFLKLVWEMMSGSNKIWVQICSGKYFHNLGFLRATNVAGTSPTWRHTVKMREFFKENVKWHLAGGDKVEALSQPWYPNWQVCVQATRRDRKTMVADLFDFTTSEWKRDQLVHLLGEEATNQITSNVQKPVQVQGLEDMLIWNHTRSGRYTAKDGYDALVNNPLAQDVPWQYIWNWKNLIPKVKIFLWRLLVNGLPLANNLHQRIHAIHPRCARCQEENEYTMHCFFFYQSSRMVWFMGNLGIRVENLPLNFAEALEYITRGMNEDTIRIVCYTLWEIWLARNAFLFQQKNFDPVAVCKKVSAWVGTNGQGPNQTPYEHIARVIVPYEFMAREWQVIIDVSWELSNKAGGAYLAYESGVLKWIGMESYQASDPFQSEAMILYSAINWIRANTGRQDNPIVHIFTDCLNLVTALQEDNLDIIPSWRARPVVARIAHQLSQEGSWISLHHVFREALKPAHNMANLARRRQTSYQGEPIAMLMMELGMGMHIEDRFFQQVQERPP
ncbi:RNA-directed DNA polymerase (reverse transcriptase)-related family protein [Rhynchospora pubera]|uniref:RNA-directed DNA polymerase (Reverse transcriptase)-related family protein n=1 Tax=Rhynchospora pubera TaxID=906938 RepID=A0AAV8G1W7_9POAL|nr:RNA-directed DNA polymerase (reverse transcriptase)-related family protein [Rhynchospora pubera]